MPTPRTRRGPLRPAARAARPAFTLMEMLVALAVTSLVLGALASTIVLAARSMPDSHDHLAANLDATLVARQIADDLADAIWVPEFETHAFTCVVPDRDGDTHAERIRYAWSGVDGAPLTRSHNGGTAAAVLASCRSFALDYHWRRQSEHYLGPISESAESVLREHTLPSMATTANISPSLRMAQYAVPSLPEDSAAWKPTAVRFKVASQGLTTGTLRVQLQEPDASRNHQPSGHALATVNILELLLGTTLAWRRENMNGVDWRAPDQGVCLVLESADLLAIGPAAKIGFDALGGAAPGSSLFTGTPDWQSPDTRALEYQLLGVYRTAPELQHLSRRHLTQVSMTIQAAGGEHAIRVTAPLHNQPEALVARWDLLDFTHRARDANADQQGDFDDYLNGLTLATRTQPAMEFNTPTTIEFAARNTNALSTGTILTAYVDWDLGGNCAGLRTILQLSGATQELRLQIMTGGAWTTVATVSDLPTEPVVVRLLVHPERDHVLLSVNGRAAGCFAYPVSSIVGATQTINANVGELGADWRRLRVLAAALEDEDAFEVDPDLLEGFELAEASHVPRR